MEVAIAAVVPTTMNPIRNKMIMHHGMRILLYMANYWLIGAYDILYKLDLSRMNL